MPAPVVSGVATKPSRFNIRAVDSSGRARYTNTRSGVVAAVDEEIDRFLQGQTETSQAMDDLLAAGFAVEEGCDEIAQVCQDYEATRNAPVLAMTIAPTVACNLRCDYCFETEHPNRYQDDDELDAIIAFARHRIRTERPTRFDVTWFGGEPLLHLAGIERLSRAFISLATFSGVPYAATIVTNGTRLTRETAKRLRRLRVLEAQITLDGAQRTHDLLRIDARGQGSYDKVMAGIEAATGLLGIDLRIHADRRTAHSIPSLLDDLANRGHQGVALSFARIEPPGVFDDPGPVDSRYLDGAEFAELERTWLHRAAELGFAVAQSVVNEHGPTPCMAVSPNHFTFEPGYQVSRCYADVANDRRRDGTLTPEGTIELTADDQRWRRYLPFDLGCAECAYLPLCVGGCPKARVDGALEPGHGTDQERLEFKERYVCHVRKFNLSQLLADGLMA
jgi:uncharacterized protein